MPTFITQQLIADLQKRTETILQKAIGQWQMYPQQVMLFKPAEASWSAAQCLMHLNSYGRYYLPAIEKSIREAETKNWHVAETFATSFIGNWFTELMQPKGEEHTIKKMKSPKEHVPFINENSNMVLAEFIDQQKLFLKLLDSAKCINLKKSRTPVSISRFIKLPLGDTLRFLLAHNDRHVLQAERAIALAQSSMVEAYKI